MVLYLIGLGLGDEKDITVRGLETLRACHHIYLEHYTAILGSVPIEKLEEYYGKKITLADREMVESQSEQIIKYAKNEDVAFLVVGDPFAATTHHDLLLRAAEESIRVVTIHNASIMNAVAQCGLQLYQFGQTVSICFFRDGSRPDSFYEKIKMNMNSNLHTLCLLDIKVKEQSFENMAKNIKIYEPPRYMTINQCISQLLEIEEVRKESVYTSSTLAFGVARLGQESQQLISGTLSELLTIDFGGPLHSLVLAAPHLHEIELSMWEYHHWDKVKRNEERRVKKLEREEEEKKMEEARKAADKIRPPPKSNIPKAKVPVKAASSSSVAAAATASSSKTEADDDDDGIVMEPLF